MRVTLLGTGGPRPDPDRQGPAVLVQAAGLNLVFDAGRGVATQLVRAGVGMADIDAVFVTHHHFDHIGGLGDLIMSAWNMWRPTPLPIHGPPGTAEVVSTLLDGVYRRDVNYRVVEERFQGVELPPPTEMVEVHETVSGSIDLLGPGGHDCRVVVGEVEHGGACLELTHADWATVGYRIETTDRAVAISGDAVPGLELGRLASKADLLVMCAYLAAGEITDDATRFLTENVLAGAPQAATVARQAAVARLALTHIRQKSDDAVAEMCREIAEVYDGEIIAGSDLLTITV